MQVTTDVPEKSAKPAPHCFSSPVIHHHCGPITSDSRYDFSCQAADRKQNIIYSQIQPAKTHTWLPAACTVEVHPRTGLPRGGQEWAKLLFKANHSLLLKEEENGVLLLLAMGISEIHLENLIAFCHDNIVSNGLRSELRTFLCESQGETWYFILWPALQTESSEQHWGTSLYS